MTGPRGIHHQRRWFYVLWVTLLLLSAGALALWERPRAVELASLAVRIQVKAAPAGTQVQVWTGPWAQWPGLAWSGAEPLPLQADAVTSLPLVRVRIARRRWVRGYIPRGTWDLMMLKFTAPGEQPRYFALPLARDIRLGLLRPRVRLFNTITVSWNNLQGDARAPDRIP